MVRRGLCLVLALQVASVHLPIQIWCAPAADAAPPRPVQACPCNPSAETCQCCCRADLPRQSSGPALGRCSCNSQAGMVLSVEPVLLVPIASAFVLIDPLVGNVAEAASVYTSVCRSLDPPPPR